MATENKQHYVKVNFEYGNDVDGDLTPKNKGGVEYYSLPYEQAVSIQAHAIVPGFILMLERLTELGVDVSGASIPGKANRLER